MATLVNGNGNVAVYAQQDADLLTGALGASTRIMNVGSKMAYTIEDANTIAVADGVILTKEGRRIQVDVGSVDEFTIPTGSAGVTRYYIIGYHLYTDGSANQKCETFVQLMENGSETITENTFRNGASEVYVSLYRVKQIGLNLDTITALLSVGIALTDMTDVIGNTDISGIGDGTLTGGLYAVNQNLTELNNVVPDTASSSNKLATMADVGDVTGEWVDISSVLRYKKIGDIVFLEFVAIYGGGWREVGTLPEEIRPPVYYPTRPQMNQTIFQSGANIMIAISIDPTTGILISYNNDNANYHGQYSYAI